MIANMVSKESLQKIKQDIDNYIGQRVCVKANIGRNKFEEKEGIISETYPNIFSVLDSKTSNNLCYSYTDLLTNTLELSLLNGDTITRTDYSVPCGVRV